MSENIEGAGRRSPGPRLLVRPLLLFASVALVIGFVAVRTDVEPYKTPFFRLFFSNTPAAYHCIFKLGFGTYDARAFIHSLLGASFYGAFSAKVLIVRTSGYPDWALPLAGGVLFAILMVLWLTSAFWLFGTLGVSL